ncbi:DUF4260 domain-containing protein [Gilvibacter sp.]|uniref:DUF4260 domain-containing protein n=1 Tax=Gilvibacter sp. TaxID=2729997 RepID=UPI003F4A1CF5
MKLSLKLEELAQFGLAIYLFSLLDFAWWWFPALLLTPDVGMLGYLVNPKIGALTYNLFHHKGVALAVYLLGVILESQELLLVGCILFGHSAMDRILGYGLKYPDSFQNTHLGPVGKQDNA